MPLIDEPMPAPGQTVGSPEAGGAALDRYTVVGRLWQREEGQVRCLACGHRCLIREGRRGVCKVRFVKDNELRVPFGYVAGMACDPVEKKPFFHLYPGARSFTFGMLGCDFHCGYCQNWFTSQALRDPSALARLEPVTPARMVALARSTGARLMVSSYNEPLITSEWAVAVFEAAREAGLECAIVSNGNATPEALDLLAPHLKACKIDLKTFDDRHYRALGGTLERVKAGIRMVFERGIWLEIVTLVVPGFNDSDEELRQVARFLRALSPDIPWHVTAFHPDYKMQEPAATTAAQLIRAARIGTDEGLHYVYAGNLPGQVGEWEATRCPRCGKVLVERCGFRVKANRILPAGRCCYCESPIAGSWRMGL